MRVEGCQHVYRSAERRQRREDRRHASADRRGGETSRVRARHAAHVWFVPAFGAQILGQMTPEPIAPARAQRAYAQPEARTPRQPFFVRSA